MSNSVYLRGRLAVALLACVASLAVHAYDQSPAGVSTNNTTTKSKSMLVHSVGNQVHYGYNSYASMIESLGGTRTPDGYPVGETGQTSLRNILVTNRSMSASGSLASRVGGCDAGLRLATLAQKWFCPPDTDPDTLVSIGTDRYVNCADYVGQFGIHKKSTGMFKLIQEANSKNSNYGATIATDTRSCVPKSQG